MDDQSLRAAPERPLRRSFLVRGGGLVSALCGGALLSGCAGAAAAARLTRALRPTPLTVALLGGATAGAQDDVPDILTALAQPLQAAIGSVKGSVPGLGNVTFQAINSTANWFPAPTTLYDVGADPRARQDDPQIPMPDVVVAPHGLLPYYLANRALDLTPYLKVNASALAGLPSAVIGRGAAYAQGAGMIQAGLPLLRVPLLCLSSTPVQAVRAGSPWTVEQFGAALAGMAAAYPPSLTSGPWPMVPYGMGLDVLAAVGSGGALAATSATAATASFAGGAIGRALEETVRLAQAYGPTGSLVTAEGSMEYGLIIADGSWVLDGSQPVFGTSSSSSASRTTWTLCPPPAFPARPVLPVRTVDALVFKHTQNPDVAAAFACQMVSAAFQQSLASYTQGLSVRSEVALRQLAALGAGTVQGAELIASAAYDATDDDAYGPLTAGNMTARALVRANLYQALDLLSAPAGWFYGWSEFDGPAGLSSPVGFGLASIGQRTGSSAAQVLQAAESATKAGRAYSG